MNEIVARAFFEELDAIEKEAGLRDFFKNEYGHLNMAVGQATLDAIPRGIHASLPGPAAQAMSTATNGLVGYGKSVLQRARKTAPAAATSAAPTFKRMAAQETAEEAAPRVVPHLLRALL